MVSKTSNDLCIYFSTAWAWLEHKINMFVLILLFGYLCCI